MKSWVYYLDRSASGVWMLYRAMEDLSDPERRNREQGQVYHRSNGWTDDDDFIMQMNRTGFVSREDVISEAEANELIASLPRKSGA